MRAALRISSTSEGITEEINDCIAACKMDLQDVGVKKLDETDALIIRAITLYCKDSKQRTCSSSGRGRSSSSNDRVRKRVQAMAADTTTLTEKMRAALRISSTSEGITEEINDCIAACKMVNREDAGGAAYKQHQ